MASTDFSKNNLDCLRLILASIVALFHVHALTDISSYSAFGKYLSPSFAVKAFFVISGLLIYRSYTRSSSIASYCEKRFRRIYPAYFTIILFAAIGLFPFSALSSAQYFGFGFWKYLAANLLFLNFLAPSLPGVFATNNLVAVNGALWTLKIEVLFYAFIPLLHYLCRRFGTKRVMSGVFILSSLWKYGFELLDSLYRSHGGYLSDSSRSIYAQLAVQFPAQLVYFSAGILLLLYLDKATHHFPAVACITAVVFLADHFLTSGVLDVIWISGIVIVFGFWRYFGNFSKHGDFSYGVYIVHWPIIQVLIALGLARLNPTIFLPISLLLIALAAFLMWHMIESRFLASSSHYRQVSIKEV